MAGVFNDTNNPSKQRTAPFDSNYESPRSCANPNIFHDILPLSYYSFDNQDDADETDKANNDLRNVSYEEEIMDVEESPAEVAMLLTSVADIATKEIKADPPIMNALADAFPRFPYVSPALLLSKDNTDECHPGEYTEKLEVEFDQCHKVVQSPPPSAALMHFDHKKARSVSMDSPELRASKAPWVPSSPPYQQEETTTPALLQWRDLSGKSTSPPHLHGIFSTPPPSPFSSSLSSRHNRGVIHTMTPNPIGRRPNLYLSAKSSLLQNRPRSISLAEVTKVPDLDLILAPITTNNDSAAIEKMTSVGSGTTKDMTKEVILRKKFSWKNYPQLEEFLIANREEYLRHSTLNYTLQQKKYNNFLTLRMIMLAAEHGYVFDETDFNFVTVRDRIRCYYKSYVQSMKKRGVVIGYAARKAGLMTEEELEESAHTSGKIYIPKN